MAPLSFAVCKNFEGEARAALEGLGDSDLSLIVFPARCGRPPLAAREVKELLGSRHADRVEVIGGVCCSALCRSTEQPDGCRVHLLENCFELVAPRPLVEAQLQEGAYLLTPGWLRSWRDRLREQGLDHADLARQVFGETATKLLLLDSGVEPDARSRLVALSEYLALPAEVLPVGIGTLRERLLRLRAEAALAAERRAQSQALAIVRQQAAEHAAALDLVGCLADSADEREIVGRTLDVCSALFAPARLAYLSVRPDGEELETRPPIEDSAERRRVANQLAHQVEPRDGFTVRIEHHGTWFGVLSVEEIAFPQFRDRYLDLASTVARVCGMAVANARAFREVKLAKESLTLERERLAVTLNGIGEGVIATDCQGEVLLVNEVCAELTGLAQHEALGRPLDEVFRVLDEHTREPLVNPVEQVLRLGRPVDLIDGALLVGRDGVEHHVAISAAPLCEDDGRTLGVVLVFRDVSAQKRTRTLQRVLEEATRLLASSLDMPRVLDEVTRRISAELGFGCSIDLSAAALSSREGADGRGTGPGRLTVPVRASDEAPPVGTFELTSSSPLDDEQVAFARELARRVALALQNAALLETTRQAVQVRDRFLSTVSHEMRTPLTSIHLQTEGFRRRIARGEAVPPDNVERLTSTVLRQVRRVGRLVDDMLDVARMNGATLELRVDAVDLSRLVAAELENRSEELRAGGYDVAVQIEPGVVGRWDPERIEQVVANLLGNAIRYGQGKPLDVELSRDRATARLRVRDRGSGIDPQDHGRIFRAFERAVLGDGTGGLGLGLYIVAQIVAAHGGSVAVESALGSGSTFIVDLPLEG